MLAHSQAHSWPFVPVALDFLLTTISTVTPTTNPVLGNQCDRTPLYTLRREPASRGIACCQEELWESARISECLRGVSWRSTTTTKTFRIPPPTSRPLSHESTSRPCLPPAPNRRTTVSLMIYHGRSQMCRRLRPPRITKARRMDRRMMHRTNPRG